MSFQRHSRADRNRHARGEPIRIDRRGTIGDPPRRWWWQASEIGRANYKIGEMVRRDSADRITDPSR